jgi:hypothetical protein
MELNAYAGSKLLSDVHFQQLLRHKYIAGWYNTRRSFEVAVFKHEFFLKVIRYREYSSKSVCSNTSLIISIWPAVKFHVFAIKCVTILT